MPFQYRQVKDLYDKLKDAGVVTSSLPEWSMEMNDLTSSDLYSAGLEDNWIKRANVGFDRLLEKTGIPDVLGSIGEEIGGWVNRPETGRQIGQGALRSVIDFLPAIAGGLPGVAVTSALAGSRTYTDTGSSSAGIASGALAAAMPAIFRAGEQVALRSIGAPLLQGRITQNVTPEVTRYLSQYLPKNISQGILGQLGGTVATGLAGEASTMLQAGLTKDDPNNPLSTYSFDLANFALNSTLGQLPFLPFQFMKQGRVPLGGKTTREYETAMRENMALTQQRMEERMAADAANAEPPLARIPVIENPVEADPTTAARIAENLAAIRGKMRQAVAEPTTPALDDYNQMAQQYNREFDSKRGLVGDDPLKLNFEPVVEQSFDTEAAAKAYVGGRYNAEIVPSGNEEYPWLVRENNQQRDLFARERAVIEADRQLDTVKNLPEFHEAIATLNEARIASGMNPLSHNAIVARAKEKSLTLKQAAKSFVSETKLRQDALTRAQEAARAAGNVDLPSENRGTISGKIIVPLKGEDPDSSPVYAMLDDVLAGEIAARNAEPAFAEWQKTNTKDATTLTTEQERFKTFWKLVQEGEINWEEPLVPAEAEALNDAIDPFHRAKDPLSLIDFPVRPHVQQWQDVVAQRIAQMKKVNPAPITPFVPNTPAQAELVTQIGKDGRSAIEFLRRSIDDPVDRQTVENFSQFADALARTKVEFLPSDIPAAAYMNPKTRAGKIMLDNSVLAMSPEGRNRLILHEVAHQLSLAELDNPTKLGIREQLDALRQRMREALPAETKARLQTAEDTGFLERYGRGEADFSELSPNWNEGNLIYAMLNTKEFVSQQFSSPAVRQFMLSQRVQKLGLWQRFKNLVKSLLGFRATDTAFDEFMRYVNPLIGQTDAVASFYNFGERFLQDRGHTREYANSQVQRAAALAQESQVFGLTPENIFSVLDGNDGVRTPEYLKSIVNLEKSVAAKDENFQQLAQLEPELGVAPSRQGLDDFAQELLRNPANIDAMDLMPETAKSYLFEKLNSMRDVVDTLSAAIAEKNNGIVALGDLKALRKPLAVAQKSLEKILAVRDAHEVALEQILGLQKVNPEGFAKDFFDSAVPATRAPWEDAEGANARKTTGFWSWLNRFLRPTAQYEDQRIREGFAKGYQIPANTRRMRQEMVKPWGIDLNSGEYDRASIERSLQQVADPVVRQAADRYIYENQKAGLETQKTDKLIETDPRIAPLLKNLTPQQRADVHDIVDKAGLSNRIGQKIMLSTMEETSQLDIAKLLNRTTDLKHEQNLVLAKELWTIARTDWNNPEAAAIAEGKIQQLQQRMDPTTFDAAVGLARARLDEVKGFESYFADNPYWASAQRFGKYRVDFTNAQGKRETQGVDSLKEAKALAKGGQIHDFYEAYRPGDEEIPTLGNSQKLVDILTAAHERAQEIRRQMGASAEELAMEERLSPVNYVANQLAAMNRVGPEPTPRNLSRGAENVPYVSNQFSVIDKIANYWSRKLFRSEMEAYIAQKELSPEIKSDLKTHMENMLQADPESIKNLNNFVRTWFMGFNPASAIMNGFQSFITHVTELTNLGAGFLGSYRRILGAQREAMGKGRSTAELQRLEQDAIHAGEFGLSQFDVEAEANENAQTNFKRFADGQKPKKLSQRLAGPLGAFQRASMAMFSAVEGFNNRVAVYAAFKLFRERGMSYEAARDAAFDFNHKVNFGGGKAQRPVGLYSGRSPVLRGAAMLASSMQNYVLGTTFQLTRLLQRGFGNTGKGLTPAERYNARLAAAQMLGTVLFAAGLTGLPFVASAIGLVNQAFPELEINKNLRAGLRNFFQEDDENGGIFTDIAMTGLPSMLGWDLQSRLSLGNTLPGTTEINGFQPQALLGPPINLISRFIDGATKVARGKPDWSLMPPGLKKITELALNGGTLKDYRERPIFDTTPGEALGAALGFNPKRLSDFNNATRMAKQAEEMQNARNAQFYQQMAEELLTGNFATVNATLRERAQSDAEFDPVAAVRSISRTAEELAFPRDLRRDGSAPTARIAQMFGLNTRQPSETQRLMFRQQIESRFGLPVSQDAIREAQLMDALRMKNPHLSRRQLRQMAESAVRRQRTAIPLL